MTEVGHHVMQFWICWAGCVVTLFIELRHDCRRIPLAVARYV